jgi:hypothetical protein
MGPEDVNWPVFVLGPLFVAEVLKVADFSGPSFAISGGVSKFSKFARRYSHSGFAWY